MVHGLRIIDARVEFTVNPLGIDESKPRFSWILEHEERGQYQSAYRVIVSSSLENAVKGIGDVWDSGKVNSRDQVIKYNGPPLSSFTKYYWRVKAWDSNGVEGDWSDVQWFETAVLKPEEWSGKWIGGGQLLRRSFRVEGSVIEAKAYVTGLGYYELRINGERVGDRVLDPPWSEYDKTVYYSVYDVTNLVKSGENVIGLILGRGRYGPVSPNRAQIPGLKYYDEPKASAMIRIRLSDGSVITINTDESWKCLVKGPILYDDIYNGYRYDARLEPYGWDKAGFDDSNWVQCSVVKPPGGRLRSTAAVPGTKVKGTLKPREYYNPRPGVYVFDFGQNITGWVRLRVRGSSGVEVKVRHSEVINSDGSLNVENIRGAEATDTYILSGRDVEVLEPRFTYHGFRYAEVTGYPGVPSIDDVEAVIVQTDFESTGSIATSSKIINDIHRITWWSLRANLLNGIQTDCPQRDERMGWLGDAWLSSDSAVFNFNMVKYYEKFIRDIIDSQRDDGSIPDTVPPYWNTYPADPAWGTALIYIPWLLYVHYGDVEILEEAYEAMKKWWSFLNSRVKDNVLYFSKYGEWVPPGRVFSAEYCPPEILSTWILYRDTLTLAQIAKVLGRGEDASFFTKRAEEIRDAFNRVFLTERGYYSKYTAPDGSVRMLGGSQTCNALPLYLDMVPGNRVNDIVKALAHNIEADWDRHLVVGIFGAKYVPEVLVKYGYVDLAYRAVTQESYPGWGYMIKEGATTLWERWEKLTGAGMNSHNHHMFGSIDAWFYRDLAGLMTLEPGFSRIMIKPNIPSELRYCSASLYTVRGLTSVEWSRVNDELVVTVTVPVNSTAEVHLPKLGESTVVREGDKVLWSGGKVVEVSPGVLSVKDAGDRIVVEVGSGRFIFTIKTIN
ncbi:alpha-L-rhamnosidase [Caldivirga maquilingensis]|uniref:alpha-L-rhamnosidase n=1 Tax=Caldivirga maquilingensis (strain ATCC 700844 / DSM 13496 / JCM 10307 / IC-167) TaxID=397948 RepID=A8MA89_CALMQ|nr:alpha-L-rhamnosidase [Caldivirga maquilingensis]ABW01021.1 alpha-L-rhamnosidase [Caldivirga maquilingensis IC-167]